MTTAELFERGREAYQRLAWGGSYERLSAADAEGALAAEHLERLATAAYLTGREDGSVAVLERAHSAFLEHGEVARAVRCAFWIAVSLLNRGRRARRRLDRPGPVACCTTGRWTGSSTATC